jgi:hypothetical protein
MKPFAIESADFDPDSIDITQCSLTGRMVVPMVRTRMHARANDYPITTILGILLVSFGVFMFGKSQQMNQVELALMMLPASLIGGWILFRQLSEKAIEPTIVEEKSYVHINPELLESFSYENQEDGSALIKIGDEIELSSVRNVESFIKAWTWAKAAGFRCEPQEA